MKHIYKLSIILISVFTFIGCNVDDDDPITVRAEKDITATLVDQRAIIAVADDATSYDLEVSFSEDLPSYATIEYSLDGNVISASTNTGGSTLNITIPITANFHNVVVSDFILVNATARGFSASLTGNTSVRIAKQGFFSATMNWASASFDLDLGLQPMTAGWGDTFAWIDTSLGVTNQEMVEGSELTDGNYALFVEHFTAAAPVDISFDISSAGGDFNFSLLTEASGNVLWFNKSTSSDGTVTYTFYTEDPA